MVVTQRKRWGLDSPSWSPDGERIAFVNVSGGKRPPSEIWVVDPDGSDRRLIATGISSSAPQWSADGKFLAWDDQEESRRLYVVWVDGGDPEIFDKRGYLVGWSHSGRHVIYNSYLGLAACTS